MDRQEDRESSRRWYDFWQSGQHAEDFDFRARLSDRNVVRNYESYNDVRLLNQRLTTQATSLLEIGCATGEFYRYMALRHPTVRYYGVDVSVPAIERARAKYPLGRFQITTPGTHLEDVSALCALAEPPHVIYAKDVVHHQTNSIEFAVKMVTAASHMIILRTRTRDVGPTEADPERSCQFHYGGWMPYIVLNLDELVEAFAAAAPNAEIVAIRNHMILGGQHLRYLPKDCYLKTTGTAETAIGVFKDTANPGKRTVLDQTDMNPRYTLLHLAHVALNRAMRSLSV